MTSQQQATAPSGGGASSAIRRLEHLWVPCLCSVQTLKLTTVGVCTALFVFCFMMFNMRDTSMSFSQNTPRESGLPHQGVSSWMNKVSDALTFQNTAKPDDTPPLSVDAFTEGPKTKQLPGAIIIGVRKGGTRALLEYLSIHPQVVAKMAEMHFFDDDAKYRNGLLWYRSQMPASRPGQLTLEKTPKYLVSEKTPERVHRMNSSVRLVLTLRHPVTRVISDYAQRKLQGSDKKSTFTDLVINKRTGEVNTRYDPIRVSTYHPHVARWLKFFPLKQIHIVDGDRLISQPLEELIALEKFLGLSRFFTDDIVYFDTTKGFYCMRKPVAPGSYQEHCLGGGKGREHPVVDNSVRIKLSEYFQKPNEILYRMIGRRFNWA